MGYDVGRELVILLSLLVVIGLWLLVPRRRGTPPVPFRTFLVRVLIIGGTISLATVSLATAGHPRDYGGIFAGTVIALFQLPDRVSTQGADLFQRVFTVLGAWWILYRA